MGLGLNKPDQPHLGFPHPPVPVGSGALFKHSPGLGIFAWVRLVLVFVFAIAMDSAKWNSLGYLGLGEFL